MAERRLEAMNATSLALAAITDGRIEDAIKWLGDAREIAYQVKAAASADKHAAALLAESPLAGAPVTTSRLPRHARPSKNGHGEST